MPHTIVLELVSSTAKLHTHNSSILPEMENSLTTLMKVGNLHAQGMGAVSIPGPEAWDRAV